MKYILDKKKALNGRSKKYELATEMGIKNTAIYHIIAELERKGVLIKDEDDFLMLPKSLNILRKTIKERIEEKGSFEFDYIFDLKIEEND